MTRPNPSNFVRNGPYAAPLRTKLALEGVVPAPGAHGGDGPAIAAALGLDPATVLDLSQSLNPFAPDVAEVAGRHLGSLARYPDPSAAGTALASAMGVEPERLLLTNGGSEAISLVAAELGGTVVAEPEFGLHPRGSGPVRWRSDPHNPGGGLAGPDETADVWDEAYYPLVTGRWTAGRRNEDGRPAWVVGSLTKVFGCPGLRLGYVLAPDAAALTSVVARQPHWSVATLALDVLVDLLATVDLAATAADIGAARDRLVAVLAGHGLAARPGVAPWVLVDAPALRARLAAHGVIVRDCTSFGWPGVHRIAVPDPAGLARLDHALGLLELR